MMLWAGVGVLGILEALGTLLEGQKGSHDPTVSIPASLAQLALMDGTAVGEN